MKVKVGQCRFTFRVFFLLFCENSPQLSRVDPQKVTLPLPMCPLPNLLHCKQFSCPFPSTQPFLFAIPPCSKTLLFSSLVHCFLMTKTILNVVVLTAEGQEWNPRQEHKRREGKQDVQQGLPANGSNMAPCKEQN